MCIGAALSLNLASIAKKGGTAACTAFTNLAWLGKDTKIIKNKAGNHVFLSKDMERRIRFDFLRPNPHNNSHMHIEKLINGEWKGPRIYPTDVPHN